jgi:hypothetical protein
VSDEPQQTYSDREIVLEFFPATHERLIPHPSQFSLKEHDGQVFISSKQGQVLLALVPVSPAGKTAVHLCCDFCQHSAARPYLQLFRAEVPESQGRHFCYVSLCRNTEACNTRRLNDEPILKLLQRIGTK